MNTVSTFHIHINGQVQGVGFRPFVFQQAQKFRICGWVSNAADGLHIEFNANELIARCVYAEIINNAPPLSHIISHGMRTVSFVRYDDFTIRESHNKGQPSLLLSPDFAMCAECRREVSDNTNRRYQYAFTTCTQCGPRYSISEQLPYDRANTTMKCFAMCALCRAEYNNPGDRRHFSQTNSCPDCPVLMKLYNKDQDVIEENQENISDRITKLWQAGHIVAIKGIGGYLLTCDAGNAVTIRELRLRKHRPSKPFAIMFPDLHRLQKGVHLAEQ
ncbi:MAG: acylphosphatase, partial [Chitinophagaceae bacterium]